MDVADAKVILENVRKFVQPALDQLVADNEALLRRIVALESQQKAMRYRGVYQPAETYEKGNFATWEGSLWVAIADAPGKPGVSGWQLAAKRGADRDTR